MADEIEELFKTKKIALLIQSHTSSLYQPWIVRGFDKTSSHKLVFSTEELPDIFSDGKRFCTFSDDELGKLESKFSSRDYANLKTPIIIAFYPTARLNTPVAILLIDNSLLTDNMALTEAVVSMIHELATPKIADIYKELYLKNQIYKRLTREDLEDKINNTITQSPTSIYFVAFSVAHLSSSGMIKKGELEHIRFLAYISALMESLISDIGEVVGYNEESLIFAISQESIDIELLVHQCWNTICMHITAGKCPAPAKSKWTQYPGKSTSISEVIEALSF